ncbi:MAG: HPr-rel-A system PqqD family peptide chaperone [Verrucomicrobiota bacterium]
MVAKYQRRPGVGEQQVGDERMLLDEASNAVHVLNGSAASIWDCLKAPVTLDEIRQRLSSEYDLGAARNVPAMIQHTLDDLQKKGLVLTVSAD